MTDRDYTMLIVGALFAASLLCALIGYGPEISRLRNRIQQARKKAEEYEESLFV